MEVKSKSMWQPLYDEVGRQVIVLAEVVAHPLPCVEALTCQTPLGVANTWPPNMDPLAAQDVVWRQEEPWGDELDEGLKVAAGLP